MKNPTTKEFCIKFGACKAGVKFALCYATMRDCYDALLRSEAGDHSVEWAIWAATREGVMPERDLRLFAVRCARRVQKLMRDERSLLALDVAERFTNGEAKAEELKAACEAAPAATWAATAAYAAAMAALGCGARWAATSAYAAVNAVIDVLECASAESAAQLRILAEFGNPFKEV